MDLWILANKIEESDHDVEKIRCLARDLSTNYFECATTNTGRPVPSKEAFVLEEYREAQIKLDILFDLVIRLQERLSELVKTAYEAQAQTKKPADAATSEGQAK